MILTEDSKSGFELFEKYANNMGLECYSAGTNSEVFKWIQNNINEKTIQIYIDDKYLYSF